MRGVLGRNWRWRREEAVPAPLRLAFVAGVVDAFVGVAAMAVARRAFGAPSQSASESGTGSPPGRPTTAVKLSMSAARVAYDVLADGRTPGRAIAGIRVERDTGRPLDLRTAIIREYSDYATGLLSKIPTRVLRRNHAGGTPADDRRLAARVWAVAVAVAVARTALRAADPQKRSLEDRIARTRPVRSRPGRRR